MAAPFSQCSRATHNLNFPAQLNVQEAIAILRPGEHASFETAEDAIAIAGDEAIRGVAQNPRQQLEEEAEKLPESAKAFEDEDDGVGAREETFVGKFVIEDDVDSVKVLGIGTVTGQDARGERTLQ